MATIGAAVAVAAAVSACGAAQDTSRAAAPAAAASSPAPFSDTSRMKVHGSRAKFYGSIKELAKDSTVIVRATATDTTRVERVGNEVGKIPFTVTTVKVTQSFKGSQAGALLQVRQLGTVDMGRTDEAPPILKAGDQYVLYLMPFEFKDRKPTGQHVVTGAAGQYGVNADGTADLMDELPGKMPAKITDQAVRDSMKP